MLTLYENVPDGLCTKMCRKKPWHCVSSENALCVVHTSRMQRGREGHVLYLPGGATDQNPLDIFYVLLCMLAPVYQISFASDGGW